MRSSAPIRSRSSSGLDGFDSTSSTPTDSACSREASSDSEVSIRIGTYEVERARSSWVSLKPSTVGMSASTMTRSNGSSWNRRTASDHEFATTPIHPSASTITSAARDAAGSSSTMRIREVLARGSSV
jgi:hypothetical protein